LQNRNLSQSHAAISRRVEKLRKEMPIRWEDQKKLFGVE